MSLLIKKVVNNPIDSNSYIIYKRNVDSCIIIDPGTDSCQELIVFFKENLIRPEYILLTHEHFDHIWGVNKLKEIYNCKIVSTKRCSEKIVNKKKNMSLFYDQVGFETYPSDIIIKNSSVLNWFDTCIEFIETEGHTDSSVCVVIDNNLFTGDTIIKGHKTVTKLPSGSHDALVRSLNTIFSKFIDKSITIFPGHKEIFNLQEITINELI